MLRGIILWWYY